MKLPKSQGTDYYILREVLAMDAKRRDIIRTHRADFTWDLFRHALLKSLNNKMDSRWMTVQTWGVFERSFS